jgi:hypothetical protein
MFPPLMVLDPSWAKVMEFGSTVPAMVKVKEPVPSVPAENIAALPSVHPTVALFPVLSVVQFVPASHVPPAFPEPGVAALVSQYNWACKGSKHSGRREKTGSSFIDSGV